MALPNISNLKFLHTANGTADSDYPVITPTAAGSAAYNAGGYLEFTKATSDSMTFTPSSGQLFRVGTGDFTVAMRLRITDTSASNLGILQAHDTSGSTTGLLIAHSDTTAKRLRISDNEITSDSGATSRADNCYTDSSTDCVIFFKRATGTITMFGDASVTTEAADSIGSYTVGGAGTFGDENVASGDKIYMGARYASGFNYWSSCRIYWVAMFDTAIADADIQDESLWTAANLRSTYVGASGVAAQAQYFARLRNG